ncbi:MAG: nickel pincer cofactor biosynthesis protein LarC [Phycisphaerae bacterium]|nr:nickel pincer cofactor biosynthesis protein LarC [Phycisphaerae bacterium]
MTLAYFDCFSGVSGDMILGALVDAGVSVDTLRERLAGLGVDGYTLTAEKVRRHGIAATQVRVELDARADMPCRHLQEVVAIIESSTLPHTVQEQAVAVFTRLAEAEARAHGTKVDEVHFHEVGAVDAIVDVVGAIVGLHELKVSRVLCSALPTGSGTVQCAHGVMPVPAPGTVALLKGVPLLPTGEPGELTTPTGAAIVTTLAESFGPLPGMIIDRWGYGAGMREGHGRPNLLRIFLGRSAVGFEADDSGAGDSTADEVVVLESNLDDISAEAVAFCAAKLLEAGALDVYTVPITMKKSRPGLLLTVLSRVSRVAGLEEIIFRETTTFGIREHYTRRVKLARHHETVETPFGSIRIKIGSRHGVVYTASPEYEDCRQAADAGGTPLREVMQAATHTWGKLRMEN